MSRTRLRGPARLSVKAEGVWSVPTTQQAVRRLFEHCRRTPQNLVLWVTSAQPKKPIPASGTSQRPTVLYPMSM